MSDHKLASPPLLLFVVLLALIARPSSVPRSVPEFPDRADPVRARNHIVRFRGYRRAEEHRAYLQGSYVGRLGGWRWIERKNPAAAFPTDFGVVQIDDEQRKELVEEFQQLELVKDVWVDSSYSRDVLLVNEGARKDGTLEEEKKKPGKLFTSMSFEEVDAEYGPSGNSSVSWTRKLMMEVNVSST